MGMRQPIILFSPVLTRCQNCSVPHSNKKIMNEDPTGIHFNNNTCVRKLYLFIVYIRQQVLLSQTYLLLVQPEP
jgi:hypothetical protein